MAKAIYSLKIYLFREQFHLSSVQLNGIRDVSIFIVTMHIEAGYMATNSVSAPNTDLSFMKSINNYSQIDATVSQKVLNKMNNHLWYLSDVAIGLAFFDHILTNNEKKKMVERLESTNATVKLINNRKMQTPTNIINRNLSDFVSIKSKQFFVRFDMFRIYEISPLYMGIKRRLPKLFHYYSTFMRCK